MTFNPQQFLDEHDGDAVRALNALNTQLDEQRGGRDREGQAAARSRRERDEARSLAAEREQALTAAQTELQQVRAQLPAQGSVVLTPEQATVYQAFEERGGLTAWDQDRTAAQGAVTARQEALMTRLAAANNWNADRLQRLLNGRTLEERELAGTDGQTQRVIGLVDGETFTDAVADLRDFAPALALTPAQPALPTRPSFIPQPPANTGPAVPTDPIQARLQQRQEAVKTAHNPLSARQ